MRALLLLAVLACACGSKEEGLTLRMSARVDAVPAGLTEGFVTVSSVELFPCAASSSLWRHVNPISTAWAHETSKPTFIGTPTVVSLTSTAPIPLGTFTPPPGQWCRVRVRFAPADGDAIGGPADAGMLGHTVVLRTASSSTVDDSTDALETAFPAVTLSAEKATSSKTLVLKPSLWTPTATSPLASEAARTSVIE